MRRSWQHIERIAEVRAEVVEEAAKALGVTERHDFVSTCLWRVWSITGSLSCLSPCTLLINLRRQETRVSIDGNGLRILCGGTQGGHEMV